MPVLIIYSVYFIFVVPALVISQDIRSTPSDTELLSNTDVSTLSQTDFIDAYIDTDLYNHFKLITEVVMEGNNTVTESNIQNDEAIEVVHNSGENIQSAIPLSAADSSTTKPLTYGLKSDDVINGSTTSGADVAITDGHGSEIPVTIGLFESSPNDENTITGLSSEALNDQEYLFTGPDLDNEELFKLSSPTEENWFEDFDTVNTYNTIADYQTTISDSEAPYEIISRDSTIEAEIGQSVEDILSENLDDDKKQIEHNIKPESITITNNPDLQYITDQTNGTTTISYLVPLAEIQEVDTTNPKQVDNDDIMSPTEENWLEEHLDEGHTSTYKSTRDDDSTNTYSIDSALHVGEDKMTIAENTATEETTSRDITTEAYIPSEEYISTTEENWFEDFDIVSTYNTIADDKTAISDSGALYEIISRGSTIEAEIGQSVEDILSENLDKKQIEHNIKPESVTITNNPDLEDITDQTNGTTTISYLVPLAEIQDVDTTNPKQGDNDYVISSTEENWLEEHLDEGHTSAYKSDDDSTNTHSIDSALHVGEDKITIAENTATEETSSRDITTEAYIPSEEYISTTEENWFEDFDIVSTYNTIADDKTTISDSGAPYEIISRDSTIETEIGSSVEDILSEDLDKKQIEHNIKPESVTITNNSVPLTKIQDVDTTNPKQVDNDYVISSTEENWLEEHLDEGHTSTYKSTTGDDSSNTYSIEESVFLTDSTLHVYADKIIAENTATEDTTSRDITAEAYIPSGEYISTPEDNWFEDFDIVTTYIADDKTSILDSIAPYEIISRDSAIEADTSQSIEHILTTTKLDNTESNTYATYSEDTVNILKELTISTDDTIEAEEYEYEVQSPVNVAITKSEEYASESTTTKQYENFEETSIYFPENFENLEGKTRTIEPIMSTKIDSIEADVKITESEEYAAESPKIQYEDSKNFDEYVKYATPVEGGTTPSNEYIATSEVVPQNTDIDTELSIRISDEYEEVYPELPIATPFIDTTVSGDVAEESKEMYSSEDIYEKADKEGDVDNSDYTDRDVELDRFNINTRNDETDHITAHPNEESSVENTPSTDYVNVLSDNSIHLDISKNEITTTSEYIHIISPIAEVTREYDAALETEKERMRFDEDGIDEDGTKVDNFLTTPEYYDDIFKSTDVTEVGSVVTEFVVDTTSYDYSKYYVPSTDSILETEWSETSSNEVTSGQTSEFLDGTNSSPTSEGQLTENLYEHILTESIEKTALYDYTEEEMVSTTDDSMVETYTATGKELILQTGSTVENMSQNEIEDSSNVLVDHFTTELIGPSTSKTTDNQVKQSDIPTELSTRTSDENGEIYTEMHTNINTGNNVADHNTENLFSEENESSTANSNEESTMENAPSVNLLPDNSVDLNISEHEITTRSEYVDIVSRFAQVTTEYNAGLETEEDTEPVHDKTEEDNQSTTTSITTEYFSKTPYAILRKGKKLHEDGIPEDETEVYIFSTTPEYFVKYNDITEIDSGVTETLVDSTSYDYSDTTFINTGKELTPETESNVEDISYAKDFKDNFTPELTDTTKVASSEQTSKSTDDSTGSSRGSEDELTGIFYEHIPTESIENTALYDYKAEEERVSTIQDIVVGKYTTDTELISQTGSTGNAMTQNKLEDISEVLVDHFTTEWTDTTNEMIELSSFDILDNYSTESSSNTEGQLIQDFHKHISTESGEKAHTLKSTISAETYSMDAEEYENRHQTPASVNVSITESEQTSQSTTTIQYEHSNGNFDESVEHSTDTEEDVPSNEYMATSETVVRNIDTTTDVSSRTADETKEIEETYTELPTAATFFYTNVPDSAKNKDNEEIIEDDINNNTTISIPYATLREDTTIDEDATTEYFDDILMSTDVSSVDTVVTEYVVEVTSSPNLQQTSDIHDDSTESSDSSKGHIENLHRHTPTESIEETTLYDYSEEETVSMVEDRLGIYTTTDEELMLQTDSTAKDVDNVTAVGTETYTTQPPRVTPSEQTSIFPEAVENRIKKITNLMPNIINDTALETLFDKLNITDDFYKLLDDLYSYLSTSRPTTDEATEIGESTDYFETTTISIEHTTPNKTTDVLDDVPYVQWRVLQQEANISIKIITENSTLYVPSNASVFEDLSNLTINVTWQSPIKSLNNSLSLALTQIGNHYLINGVQLSLVRGDDLLVWKKHGVIIPKHRIPGEKGFGFELEDGIQVYISDNGIFLLPDLDNEIEKADGRSSSSNTKRTHQVEIATGATGAVVTLSAIAFVLLRARRRSQEMTISDQYVAA